MFEGQNCLVIGTGISGMGALYLLEKWKARVFLYDSRKDITSEEVRKKLPEGSEAVCIVGELPREIEEKADILVLSPGIPTDIPLVQRLKEKGILILGEIELGFLADQGQIVAITGTNGKTSTTTLVGEIMKAHLGEEKVFVVGNIGNSYTRAALNTAPDTVTVAEISSFQLETIHNFHPGASAVLNITPDHLDRHHTMEFYCRAKERIAENQTSEDICVLNADNEYTKAFAANCPARTILFSSKKELEEGFFLRGDMIVKRAHGYTQELLNIHTDMRLMGICNAENVMAAIALTESRGVPMETILQVIKEFPPVEHRIEFVATKDSVDYYNDSKATNPDAAIWGIRSMNKPTILIGGGYDKHNEYDEWIESFDGKVKWLVLVGQTREKIAECARAHGFTRVRLSESFTECLELCTQLAESGDAVLLSPACASWGMFPDYEVRGRAFKEYVNQL